MYYVSLSPPSPSLCACVYEWWMYRGCGPPDMGTGNQIRSCKKYKMLLTTETSFWFQVAFE